MRKALILGTNAGQADIIRYLKKKQWHVDSCGHRKKGPGIEYADSFHLVDILDVQKVKDLAEKLQPDIVYSISSDIAIRTATKVSEDLNLPHLLNSELVELFHYKQQLRSYLNKHDIGHVNFKIVSSADELKGWTHLPCIVKPVDSYGQKGLAFIENENQLEQAVTAALENSESSSAIIEEYLDGIEVSAHFIVQDQKIVLNEFTERYVHTNQYFGLPSGHAIPVRNVGRSDIKEASKLAEKLIKSLQIRDAVFYIQFKITSEGPKIIEVAPRLDGCHIWRLLHYSRHYDLRELAIKCLLGLTIEPVKPVHEIEPHTLSFYQLKPGEKFSTNEIETSDDFLFEEFRYRDGDVIEPVNGSLEVAGYSVRKG